MRQKHPVHLPQLAAAHGRDGGLGNMTWMCHKNKKCQTYHAKTNNDIPNNNNNTNNGWPGKSSRKKVVPSFFCWSRWICGAKRRGFWPLWGQTGWSCPLNLPARASRQFPTSSGLPICSSLKSHPLDPLDHHSEAEHIRLHRTVQSLQNLLDETHLLKDRIPSTSKISNFLMKSQCKVLHNILKWWLRAMVLWLRGCCTWKELLRGQLAPISRWQTSWDANGRLVWALPLSQSSQRLRWTGPNKSDSAGVMENFYGLHPQLHWQSAVKESYYGM